MHRVAKFKPPNRAIKTVVRPRIAVTSSTILKLPQTPNYQLKSSITSLNFRPAKFFLNVRYNSTTGNNVDDKSSSEPKKDDEPKETQTETTPETTPETETPSDFSEVPDVNVELIDFEELESKFKYEPSLKLRWEGEIDWKDADILKARKTTFEHEEATQKLIDKATELYNQHKSGNKISNDEIIDLNEQLLNSRHRINVDIEYVMQFFKQKRSEFAQSEEYMMKLLTEEYETYVSIKKKIEETKNIDLEQGSDETEKYNQARRDFILLQNTWQEMQEKKPGAINAALDYDRDMKILFKEMKDKEEAARKAQAAIELLEVIYSDNMGGSAKLPQQGNKTAGGSLSSRIGGGFALLMFLLALFMLYDLWDDERKARLKLLFNQSVWDQSQLYVNRRFDADLERSVAKDAAEDTVVVAINMIEGGGKTISLEHALRNLIHIIRFSAESSSNPDVLADNLKKALDIPISPKSFDELIQMIEKLTVELKQDTGIFAIRQKAPVLVQRIENFLHESDSYILRDIVLKLFGHPKLQNVPVMFIDDLRLDTEGANFLTSLIKEQPVFRTVATVSVIGRDTDVSKLTDATKSKKPTVAWVHFEPLTPPESAHFINGVAGLLAERNNQERWQLSQQQISLITQIVGTSPGMIRYFMEGLNERLQQRPRFVQEGLRRVPHQLTVLLELKSFMNDKRDDYQKMVLTAQERSVLMAIARNQNTNVGLDVLTALGKRFADMGIITKNVATERGVFAKTWIQSINDGSWDKLQKVIDADIAKLRPTQRTSRPQQKQ